MQLADALGTGWGAHFRLEGLRYQRLLLLMDPDADGIHCGALLTLFLFRWMRPLIDHGHVVNIRAPLNEIMTVHRRGLASFPPQVLHANCIDPATRRAHVVTAADAEAAIDVFGRG